MQQRMEDKTVAISVSGARVGARLLRDLAQSYLRMDRSPRTAAQTVRDPDDAAGPAGLRPVSDDRSDAHALRPEGRRRAGALLSPRAPDEKGRTAPDPEYGSGSVREEEIRTVRGRVIAPLPVPADRNEIAPFRDAAARNGVSFAFRRSDDGTLWLFFRAKDEPAIRGAFADYLASTPMRRPYLAERLRARTPLPALSPEKELPVSRESAAPIPLRGNEAHPRIR